MMDKPNRDRNHSKKTSWEKKDSFTKAMRKSRVVDSDDNWREELQDAINTKRNTIDV